MEACYNITMRDIEKKRASDRRYKEKNREVLRLKQKQKRREYKKIVFDYYGNECASCGFKDIRALQIDHINNNGAEERKANGGQWFSGHHFYKYLIDNGMPGGYQTLCANCNMIKQLGEDF
jgi:hypothetical protein